MCLQHPYGTRSQSEPKFERTGVKLEAFYTKRHKNESYHKVCCYLWNGLQIKRLKKNARTTDTQTNTHAYMRNAIFHVSNNMWFFSSAPRLLLPFPFAPNLFALTFFRRNINWAWDWKWKWKIFKNIFLFFRSPISCSCTHSLAEQNWQTEVNYFLILIVKCMDICT